MKPEDLKRPFKWDARTPLIKDRVFYVPEFYPNYEEFSFPKWEDQAIFGNNQSVRIEYCSGNGQWIANCALKDPSTNWVAVEKRFDRVRKIWSKMKNHSMANLFAIAGEGLTVTKHYFPSQSVEEIYINFPDPWPKTRHAKHRIVQGAFVSEMWRILKNNGKVTIVTDDPDYSKIIIEEMAEQGIFASNFEMPYYVEELPFYGTSYFEELWRGKGKKIRYHQFNKVL